MCMFVRMYVCVFVCVRVRICDMYVQECCVCTLSFFLFFSLSLTHARTHTHTATLRLFPFAMLVPLLRVAKAPQARDILINHGLAGLLTKFIRKFIRAREASYATALRKADAARKVAGAGAGEGDATAIHVDAGCVWYLPIPKTGQGSSHARPHLCTYRCVFEGKAGSVEPDFGLPPRDSEEDMQQCRTVRECLSLMCLLCKCREGALALHAAGAVTTVASLVVNRNKVAVLCSASLDATRMHICTEQIQAAGIRTAIDTASPAATEGSHVYMEYTNSKQEQTQTQTHNENPHMKTKTLAAGA